MKSKDTSAITDNIVLRKVLANPLIVILSNWVFQGMRYMEPGERAFKLLCSLIPAIIAMLFLKHIELKFTPINIFFCLLLGHTLNWLLNGQIFVLFRYLPFKGRMSIDRMKKFIFDLHKITYGKPYLLSVLIFGSLSKGKISANSDLDVRIIRKKGIIFAINAYLLALKLRIFAFIKGFPLDIYIFGNPIYLKRIREDEPPVIIFDDGFVAKYYDKFSYYEDIVNNMTFRNAR